MRGHRAGRTTRDRIGAGGRRRRATLASLAVLVLVLGTATLTVGAAPAGADCVGPTLHHPPAAVARGATVTLTASGFGDNCYDTGPPPDGEGILGRPVTGIGIFVARDGKETLVARGDANPDYAFTVDVVIPPDTTPGEAHLVARWTTGQAGQAEQAVIGSSPGKTGGLTITDAAPAGGVAGVATFGPPGSPEPPDYGPRPTRPQSASPYPPPASGPAEDGNGGRSSWFPLLAGGLVVIGLAGASYSVLRRRTPTN